MRMARLLILLLSSGFAFTQELQQAQQLEGAGQIETAYKLYQQVVIKNPDQTAAVAGLIRTAVSLRRFDSLLVLLERVKPVARNQNPLELGIIEALFGLKRRAEAISRLERLLRTAPELTSAAIELLYRVQEYTLAIRYLEALLNERFQPQHAHRLFDLYEKTGRLSAAAALIVRLANADTSIHAAFSRYLLQNQDRIRAWGSKPGLPNLLAELGKIQNRQLRARIRAQLLLGAGREQEAARELLSAHRYRSLPAPDLLGIAREWEKNGWHQAAFSIYEQLGQMAAAARVLRLQGKIDQALLFLKSDTTPEGLFEYAELLREEKNDFQAAAASYYRLLRLRPDYRDAWLGLAAALVGSGQLDSARRVIARLQPDDRILLLKAKILLYQHQFDSLAAVINEFTRFYIDSPLANDLFELGTLNLAGDARNELASVLFALERGDYHEARRRAARLRQGDEFTVQQALLITAEIHRRQHRYHDALAVLDTLINSFPRGELTPAALYRQFEILKTGIRDIHRARLTAERLIQEYPGSPYAPLVRSQLQRELVPQPGTAH